jgi:hypothetical protein
MQNNKRAIGSALSSLCAPWIKRENNIDIARKVFHSLLWQIFNSWTLHKAFFCVI